MLLLTKLRTYHNTSNPNGLSSPALPKQDIHRYAGWYLVQDRLRMAIRSGAIDGASDPYWNTALDNLEDGSGSTYSQVGVWFNQCIASPTYNTTLYKRPNFPAGFDGWVQAIQLAHPHALAGWQRHVRLARQHVGGRHWLLVA